MKLNNQQIQALAEKISRELQNEVDKKNKEIIDKIRAWYTKKLSLKENKGLREYYEYINNYHRDNVNEFLIRKYPTESSNLPETKQKRYSSNEIRNDIVIETIECENIQEIIDKIKAKYTK